MADLDVAGLMVSSGRAQGRSCVAGSGPSPAVKVVAVSQGFGCPSWAVLDPSGDATPAVWLVCHGFAAQRKGC
jgi:hypothetical protein